MHFLSPICFSLAQTLKHNNITKLQYYGALAWSDFIFFRKDSQHRQLVQPDSVQRVASFPDCGRQPARHGEPGDPGDSLPGDRGHPVCDHPLLPPLGVQV